MQATCVKARFSTSVRFLSTFCVALWLGAPRTVADESRFFRIVGPTATIITAFTPDGYITWTNAQPGITYTVQTAPILGAANWLDYIQVGMQRRMSEGPIHAGLSSR